MTSYTKLFSSLLTSTIWAESDQTRIVWVTMLAMADQHGEVHSTVPGLARIAGVPLSEVEAALAKFTGPDPYSRTKDNDGRRIAEIDGGWELLNHAKYRSMASREDSKAQAADRQRRKRERDESRSVTPCHAPSRSVTDSHASVTQSLHIAEAEAEAEKDVGASAKPAPTSDEDFIASLETNEAYTGIDIRREFVRMKTWCDVNRKKPTKRRFVNWLNRADRPMDANPKATAQPSPRISIFDAL